MLLYNIKHPEEQVTFCEAVIKGIGKNSGLYFPKAIPKFLDISSLLEQDFVSRSITILQKLLGEEFSEKALEKIVTTAFNFPLEIKQIEENIFALELFHGPTLAFKDFGARFMSQVLHEIGRQNSTKPKSHNPKITIVTATSGDTGAAVADAFFGAEDIQVIIFYPYQRISELQEKLFCTLGNNIHTFAVKGSFDDCQAIVKQCFLDPEILQNFTLNSANSINISRLLAQTLYYFEALAQLPLKRCDMVSVPSGNFGNLTAGLISQAMGLPIRKFVAATNANDTIPRFLSTGVWSPNATIPTLSNAMDVSQPNNWPRIEELCKQKQINLGDLVEAVSVSEEETSLSMKQLQGNGYIAEPHSAVGYSALKSKLNKQDQGVFLCTAHPVKFKESVDRILQVDTDIPTKVMAVKDKVILSHVVENNFLEIKRQLLEELI